MKRIEELNFSEAGKEFVATLGKEIIVLDGAMGTMIQCLALTEDDFRGEKFKNLGINIAGCNDVLSVTKPDVIAEIHCSYLEAGARVITTNTFNSNAFSLADYGLESSVAELNYKGAALARSVADDYMKKYVGKRCWVAGSVGPTSHSLTMELGSGIPKLKWDDLEKTYIEQIKSLIEGGADIILIETVFDTLNAKCAAYSARRAMELCERRLPMVISATLTESGRTLSGQTLDALTATLLPFEPAAIGLNCGFGASGMLRYVSQMQNLPVALSLYPNAGLPNALGAYDETPAKMVADLAPMLRSGMLNMIGGCCGTTPEHIKVIAELASQCVPHVIPKLSDEMILAGLEQKTVSKTTGFVNVGERCNVAGSRKFLRLIKEGSLNEAITIARIQVEAGAQVVDVNMDDAMLDSSSEIARFLATVGVEPDVARVPVMIDSSDWNTIVAALKTVQGRPIVNSISLKEGEDAFIRKARYIREMGAAVVVMAFDEDGQADTLVRRKQVAERAYKILTQKVGFKGCDIVIDPNVLSVATGIEEHNSYAADFLEAISWIKTNLPGAKVSGGISNLSFAFRGNNPLRESMHALFLYHAISRGMDMAIVNAAQLFNVDEIDAQHRKALEDVIFNTDAEATNRLIEIAPEFQNSAEKKEEIVDIHQLSPIEQLESAVVKGVTDKFEELLPKVHAQLGSALSVIDGPLMAGITRVGKLFGEGKMFLPQVVKSARAMSVAVDILTPYINKEKSSGSVAGTTRRMVLATVKGDVHDIGKNIVAVVMNCNGIEVTDLGVMVPAEDILDAAQRLNADFVALSGLITPSLDEMCNVARQMQKRGMRIPLLIGGATTSALHTAVKIAPCYDGLVAYTRDAAAMPELVQKLSEPLRAESVVRQIKDEQRKLRKEFNSEPKLLSLSEARRQALKSQNTDKLPRKKGLFTFSVPLDELTGLINWKAYLAVWGLEPSLGSYGIVAGCDHCKSTWLASVPFDKQMQAKQAIELIDSAIQRIGQMKQLGIEPIARVGIFSSTVADDSVIVDQQVKIPFLRRQDVGGGYKPACLADYIGDYIGLFAVTSGRWLGEQAAAARLEKNEYEALVCDALSHRLAEAATEWTHRYVAEKLWGYAPAGSDSVPGIRPAIGYPSLPDQSLVFVLDRLLKYNEMDIALTEHGALSPSATTTGLILPNPDSRYFSVGVIGDDQRADYARRRGMSTNDLAVFLPV
ncbi:MAG: methionine synthase [Muribaculum sp.]|nr:methionine synthase [Muribaculaceae bacterium]MCM1081392.1 methionine synthase [Muribaculum sp.]